MKVWHRIGWVLVLTILISWTAAPVWADDPDGDVVIWGDNYTLKAGERIDGDLLVYGGNVNLQERSRVDGDVNVFGGNLTIFGQVDGDVTVWGGNVKLKSDAVVRGSVVSVGGNLSREEGADVRGSEVQGWPFPPPRIPLPPRIPRIRIQRPLESRVLSNVGNAVRTVFSVFVMIVLGILVVVFIPKHTEIVSETMVKAPVQSFTSGVVAFVGVPVVAVVLAITVCLLPASALILLVTGVGLLFGWIASGLLFGVKVLRALNHKDPNRVAAVAVGMPILSILALVPCIGWAITLVLLTWSLGAVVYSFFGTRAYNEPAPRLWSSASASRQANAPDEAEPEGYDPRMDKL